MTIGNWNHQYGIGVQDQGHMYLSLGLYHVVVSYFTTEGGDIWQNDGLRFEEI